MGRFSHIAEGTQPKKARFTHVATGEKPAPVAPEPEQQSDSFDIDRIRGDINKQFQDFGVQQAGQFEHFKAGLDRKGSGVSQLIMSGLEKAGLIDEGETDKFTDIQGDHFEALDKELKEKYGEKFVFDAANFVGQSGGGAEFLLPGTGQTALARTVGGALTGGASAVTEFAEEGTSKLDQMLVGLGLGGGLSGLLEFRKVLDIFKKHVGSGVRSIDPDIERAANLEISKYNGSLVPDVGADDVAKAQQLAEEKVKRNMTAQQGMDISEKTGVDLKLSQIDPDPTIEGLESFSRSTAAGERAARAIEDKQPGQVYKYFKRVAAKLDDSKESFGPRLERVFNETMGDSKSGTGLIGKRAVQAKNDFGLVDDTLEIPIDNTLSKLDEWIAKTTEPGSSPASKKMGEQLATMREELSAGTMNPSQLQNRLEEWGRASKGTGKIFKDLDSAADRKPASDIFGALKDDLDSAADSGLSVELRTARDNYREASSLITEVEQSALGKLFGGKFSPDVSKIGETFLKMRPDQIRSTMQILSKTDPNIQSGLQRFWLESQLRKANVEGPSGILAFVPGMMLDLRRGTNRETYKAVFNSAASRRSVSLGLSAVKRIMLNNQRTGGRTLPKVKELAGVLASRDKTFAARLGAELFLPSTLTKALFDPEGVKALQELSKPFNQNRWTSALVTLSDIVGQSSESGKESQSQQEPQ